jgi:hypothetical protein
MTKQRQINVSLISPGVLVENHHYGPYSRYWWKPIPNSEEITTYFPIRVKQTTKATLNNLEFTITVVVGNKDNDNFLPGYVCQCNDIIKVANDPTNAISEVYSKIFATKTRYSGSLIMGWNDENIRNKLSEDVPFTPCSFLLDKIKIFVYGVGYSTHMDWYYAGPGYRSSLLCNFGNKQALFVSKIEKTLCTVEVYQDQKLQIAYTSKNPIDVWKNLESIKKYNGNQLFGIDNDTIKTLNQNQKRPTCSPQEWKDDTIMKVLFDFHLKRRTIVNINWYQLFIKWNEQESPLIELNNELHNIYPENYQFNIREMGAWQTFLHAAGANNITPWSREEKVLLRKISNINYLFKILQK